MKDKKKFNFARRSFLIGLGKASIGACIIARLAYLQIFKHSDFLNNSLKNKRRLRFIEPFRGAILDRNGVTLACDKATYTAYIESCSQEQFYKELQNLKLFFQWSDETLSTIYKFGKKIPHYLPRPICQDITWQQICNFSIHKQKFPLTFIEYGRKRFYPLKEIACPITGYVQRINQPRKPQDYLLFEGKNSLEKEYNTKIQGSAGHEEIEVDARGNRIQQLSFKPYTRGKNIITTIDSKLQSLLYKSMEHHKAASGVLMDANSGHILAMVSIPSFDPNILVKNVSEKKWNKLINNPYGILTNKALSGLYSPGSVFKIVTAIAAIEEKIITAEEKITCSGFLEIKGHRFHCWKAHGKVNIFEAIASSCDTYFYLVAQKLGMDLIQKYAYMLGFSPESLIPFPGIKTGLIPNATWKKNKFNKPWYIGETILAGIGQGYVQSNILQLATMGARVATGKLVFPTLIHQNQSFPNLKIKESTLKIIRKSMEYVISSPKGTLKKLQKSPIQVAAKSGTTQVKRITLAERKSGLINQRNRIWKYRDHCLFTGFTPIHNPKYIISTVIEHGGYASSSTIPTLLDFFQRWKQI